MRKKRPLSCTEAGRRGGNARKRNLSPERASELGRVAGLANEARLRRIAAEKAAEPKGNV